MNMTIYGITENLRENGINSHLPRKLGKYRPELQPLVRRSTMSKEMFNKRKSKNERRTFSVSPAKKRSPSLDNGKEVYSRDKQRRLGKTISESLSVPEMKKGANSKCKLA